MCLWHKIWSQCLWELDFWKPGKWSKTNTFLPDKQIIFLQLSLLIALWHMRKKMADHVLCDTELVFFGNTCTILNWHQIIKSMVVEKTILSWRNFLKEVLRWTLQKKGKISFFLKGCSFTSHYAEFYLNPRKRQGCYA